MCLNDRISLHVIHCHCKLRSVSYGAMLGGTVIYHYTRNLQKDIIRSTAIASSQKLGLDSIIAEYIQTFSKWQRHKCGCVAE